MKILYILSGTGLGGATLSFLTLLNEVLSKGHTAVLVAPDEKPEFIERLNSNNVKLYVLPMAFNAWPRFYGIKRFLGYPYVLLREQLFLKNSRQKLNCIIQKELPDIIHTNVGPLDIGHHVAKKNGIPHVWHIREYSDKDFNIHLFPSKHRYQLKQQSDYTICITKDLQRYNHLTDNPRSCVVYNGVRSVNDLSYVPIKKKYFLMASRVSEERGQIRTIRVFARFCKSHPDYKLVILGDGYDYYVNQCKPLAVELGITDNVVFEGFKQNVDSYMRKTTALLVASQSEGFGRMTAEAAFNGCVVVGHNTAGTKEILKSTGGFLWNNDEEYYNALIGVSSLSEGDYRQRILKAQEAAKQLFCIESYVKNVNDVYQAALSKQLLRINSSSDAEQKD